MAMLNTSATDQLIVALDMPTRREAEYLIADLGEAVSFYKIGLELLFAGGLDLAQVLTSGNKKVFLDLKLLDIGNTVERAVSNASELGVNFLTIHGHDHKTLHAAVSGRGSSATKLLAVTVLTSLSDDDLRQQGSNLTTTELVLRRAKMAYEEGFDGVVASGQEAAQIRAITGPEFIIVTPGIRLMGSAMNDQERVMTPEHAIHSGANHIVVGRPITQADNPRVAALNFVQHIWGARTAN